MLGEKGLFATIIEASQEKISHGLCMSALGRKTPARCGGTSVELTAAQAREKSLAALERMSGHFEPVMSLIDKASDGGFFHLELKLGKIPINVHQKVLCGYLEKLGYEVVFRAETMHVSWQEVVEE